MYIYHAPINALSAHTIHINLNMILYTHAERSPTKTVYIRHFMETHTHTHARAHTHARMHARTHARTHTRTHARTHAHTHTHASNMIHQLAQVSRERCMNIEERGMLLARHPPPVPYTILLLSPSLRPPPPPHTHPCLPPFPSPPPPLFPQPLLTQVI